MRIIYRERKRRKASGAALPTRKTSAAVPQQNLEIIRKVREQVEKN